MNAFNFLIRDAVTGDIEKCIALDHSYDTDHVWRMVMQDISGGYQITFRKERLPRTNTLQHDCDELRLRLALPREVCYLIATAKDRPDVLGYLTMRPDPIHRIGLLQDIVVEKQYRQFGIGTRLLAVARRWMQENGAHQLMVEVPTKNYPAIAFFQNQGLTFCGFNDQYFRNRDISVFLGQTLR